MLSEVVSNWGGNQRGPQQENIDTSRIRELLMMNTLSFTCSSTTNKNQKNCIKVLQKVFDVMNVAGTERVELLAFQMRGVSSIWIDQWKENGV